MIFSIFRACKLVFIEITIILLLSFYACKSQAQAVVSVCKQKKYYDQYADLITQKCKQDRSSSVCKRLESEIKKNGVDPETKLKQCARTGVKRELVFEYIPFVSSVACINGAVDFGLDSIKSIGKFLGEFAGAVKIDFDQSKERSDKCNSSIENKIALYRSFNLLTPKLMNIVIPPKETINKKKCWQIEFDLREYSRYQQRKIENNLMPRGLKGQLNLMSPEEKEFWQWRHPEVSNGSGHSDLIKKAKEIIKQKGLELDCYDSYTAQALVCEAVAEAAFLLLGAQSSLKQISRASKISEIAGVSRSSKKIITRILETEIKNTKLLEFVYKYDIDYEPILVNGQEFLRIIPNKYGHWLARQAEVYKRRYNTDFLIASPNGLAVNSPAEFEVFSSSEQSYNFLKISSNLNLDNTTQAMGILAHEYVHIRNQAAGIGLASRNADTPITILSSNSKIPISGYSALVATDEVGAYARSVEVYKRGLQQAQQANDLKSINKYSALLTDAKEQLISHQKFTEHTLTNAKSAAEKFDLYDKPAKEYGSLRTTIITYDATGNEFPVIFEFPLNTPTDPAKFKSILLERIQREIEKNRKMIHKLVP